MITSKERADDHRRQQGNAGITSIVWATGFRYDFDWLKLPIFDDTGESITDMVSRVFPASIPWIEIAL
jgi:hypothetical protein